MTTSRLLLELPTEIKCKIISEMNIFDIQLEPTQVKEEDMSAEKIMVKYANIRRQVVPIYRMLKSCKELNAIINSSFFQKQLDETKLSILMFLIAVKDWISSLYIQYWQDMTSLVSQNPNLLFQRGRGFGYGYWERGRDMRFRNLMPYQVSILLEQDCVEIVPSQLLAFFSQYLTQEELLEQVIELENILKSKNSREERIQATTSLYPSSQFWWERDIDNFIYSKVLKNNVCERKVWNWRIGKLREILGPVEIYKLILQQKWCSEKEIKLIELIERNIEVLLEKGLNRYYYRDYNEQLETVLISLSAFQYAFLLNDYNSCSVLARYLTREQVMEQLLELRMSGVDYRMKNSNDQYTTLDERIASIMIFLDNKELYQDATNVGLRSLSC